MVSKICPSQNFPIGWDAWHTNVLHGHFSVNSPCCFCASGMRTILKPSGWFVKPWTPLYSIVISCYRSWCFWKNISTPFINTHKNTLQEVLSIRTRVAGVPSQWHNPWNWKCAFINFLKVGDANRFSHMSSSFPCRSSQRDNDDVEELTTCKKWRLAGNSWLTWFSPWIPLINMLPLPPSMKVPSRFWQLLPWHLDLNPEIHASSCIIYLVFSLLNGWEGRRSEYLNKFQRKDAKWNQTGKLACWSSKSKPSRWGCLVDLPPGAPGFQSLAGLSHL